MGNCSIVDKSSACVATGPGFKPHGVNSFIQRISHFRKHDVIFDDMETWLQQDYNFKDHVIKFGLIVKCKMKVTFVRCKFNRRMLE